MTLNNRNNVCFFQMQCLLSFNLLKYGLQDTLHKVKYSSSKVKKLSRGQENLLLKKKSSLPGQEELVKPCKQYKDEYENKAKPFKNDINWNDKTKSIQENYYEKDTLHMSLDQILPASCWKEGNGTSNERTTVWLVYRYLHWKLVYCIHYLKCRQNSFSISGLINYLMIRNSNQNLCFQTNGWKSGCVNTVWVWKN